MAVKKEIFQYQPVTIEGQTDPAPIKMTETKPETPSTQKNTDVTETKTPTLMGEVKTPNTSSAKKTYASFQYGDYTESDAVKKAKEALDQKLANAPGAYESSWQKTIDDTIEKIMNREKFSYDVNGDALFQQYKDQFTRQGKLAMQDTMGKAAAMTGGYGNSYAATVGNQAYQQSMQDLGNVIPELYQLAYERYAGETRDLYDQYALLGDRESIDYGRYRDEVNDHQAELDRLQNQYNTEREFDYGKYADDRNFDYGVFENDRAFAYQQERDAAADEQWQKNFDEALRQYEESKQVSTVTKPVTMSVDDYDYWTTKFADAKSEAEAAALRDQMVLAVGDESMAYALMFDWESKHSQDEKIDVTVNKVN